MNFYTYCRVGKKEDEEISNSYQLCKINSKRKE